MWVFKVANKRLGGVGNNSTNFQKNNLDHQIFLCKSHKNRAFFAINTIRLEK